MHINMVFMRAPVMVVAIGESMSSVVFVFYRIL